MAATLADRPYPQWPVRVASELMVERARRREECERLAACPALSESWRKFIVDADREFQEQRKSR